MGDTRRAPTGCATVTTVVAVLLLTLLVPTEATRGANRAALRKIQEDAGIPALGYLVLERGRVKDLQAVGLRRTNGTLPVTVDDKWHIGSCAKAMTATVLGRLVDRGMLRWDSALSEVFRTVHPQLARATVWDLLTHRSGLAANFALADFKDRPIDPVLAARQRKKLVRAALLQKPQYSPGTKTVYSNLGYTAAGLVAETVTGKRWDVLLREELFGPLGAHGWGLGAPGVGDPDSQPWGHVVIGPQNETFPVTPGPRADNPISIAPAGTLHIPLRAWARFARAHLREGRSGLLKQKTFDRLHRPTSDGYAGGWVVTDGYESFKNTTVWTHGGSNTIWLAQAVLVPRRSTAVLLVSNTGQIAEASAAFRRVLNEIVVPQLKTVSN